MPAVETTVAMVAAIGAVCVTLIQECRRSRCTEVDICDCLHIRREVCKSADKPPYQEAVDTAT